MKAQETRGTVSAELPAQREQLATFLREHGIARLAEIRRAGITAATVSRLEREGLVIKLGRGLYQLADAAPEGNHSLAEAGDEPAPIARQDLPEPAVCRRREKCRPEPGKKCLYCADHNNDQRHRIDDDYCVSRNKTQPFLHRPLSGPD